ncbi:diguanylate cyclase [Alkalihalobacterium alkalinitrilicum]
MSSCIRDKDIVARQAGDEFIILSTQNKSFFWICNRC